VRIAEFVGQRDLTVTANTYSHVMIDEAELDYAALLQLRVFGALISLATCETIVLPIPGGEGSSEHAQALCIGRALRGGLVGPDGFECLFRAHR
jgi:hypothetical protein